MNLTPDNKRTLGRIWSYAALILSGLVLLFSVCGILGAWAGYGIASNAVIDLSVAVESTAQAVERGVVRVHTSVTNLKTEVQDIDTRIANFSDTVADQGLVMTLLPEERVQKLDNLSSRLTETFTAVNDAYQAAQQLTTSLNRIPGVSLPSGQGPVMQEIGATLDQIQQDMTEFRGAVSGVRQKQAAQVARLKNVTGRIETALTRAETELNDFQTVLVNIQNVSKQIRQTVPGILLGGTLLLTLVIVWVMVSQVLVIRQMWRALKTPAPDTAAPSPPAPETPALSPPTAAPPEAASP